MKTKWYKQLEKGVDAQASVQKLKVSDETFSVNYQEDFAVSDAL
ncbi:MAG: hypothetical protein O6703_03020 [Gammaproteobacteria bacterium]|nr:hypothetical protein [Gammaproteobacteria bacterium]